MNTLSVDHLLGIKYLKKEDIELIFKTADNFKKIINQPIKKVPSLRDITIANLFFENSTRTKLSFELAEKRLSADVINFSSVTKFDLSELDLKEFLVNLIDEKYYKKNDFIKNNIYKYIECYFLNLMNLKYSRNKINAFYSEFIRKIYDLKKFNLDEESFFIELKTKILNG